TDRAFWPGIPVRPSGRDRVAPMTFRRRVALTLLAALLALALPASASAVTYEVNSTADEDDKSIGGEVCETAVAGKCTLRAAIEESNASTTANDLIKFAPSFDGQLEDTIAITLGEFPVITDQVVIDGNKAGARCDTQAG